MQNWAGSYEFQGSLTTPGSMQELQELIARSAHVGVIGTRHSFHDLADSPGGALVSLENFPRGVTVCKGGERGPAVALVQGMVSYGQLGAFLDRLGYAVRNLASLPHISVI